MPDPTVCLQRSCWVHALVNLSCFGSSMQVTNKHNAIRFWPIDIWVFWHKMVYNVLLIHPSTHSHLHADGGKPKPIKDTLAEELKPNMHFVEILTFPETWALLYHMTTIKLWWKDKEKTTTMWCPYTKIPVVNSVMVLSLWANVLTFAKFMVHWVLYFWLSFRTLVFKFWLHV